MADVSVRLVIFDDVRAREWEPLALTRPAGELLLGGRKIVERVEAALGLECAGYLTSHHLTDFQEPGSRPTLREDDLDGPMETLFWCARAVPDDAVEITAGQDRTAFVMGGVTVGYQAAAGQWPEPSFFAALETPAMDRAVEVKGKLLGWIWDLVEETPARVAADLAAGAEADPGSLPEGVHAIGDAGLELGADVTLEPGVVLDLREGPIRLEDGVEIRAGTRLAGPSWVGPGSRLLGGHLEAIVTGPVTYLRGEVSHSVILGYTNKAHDGYLGHAYVGRWVNLGALTTNSDLKNNYNPVRVWTPGGVRDTGLSKVGCFLGDHVKTGIGTLIGTGTVVGAGANIYGTEMPPTYVPPFSWGEAGNLGEYREEAFLATAGKVMGRRGMPLDDRGRRYLRSCWRKGRGG